jgi:thiol:disulfide interchange protein DsbC
MRWAERVIQGVLAATLLAAAVVARADESQIRQAVEAKLGGVKVEAVRATPLAGIYEVQIQTGGGPQILYVDEAVNFAFDGSLHDLRTKKNLTAERLRRLSAIDFGTLPLDLAVKVQRGDGHRVLAVFSDPYCPYCRHLEKELLQINDITVYVFMFPVIKPSAADQSRAVWCSKDRAKAWLDLAARDQPKVPTAAATCANPVDKVLELGRRLHVSGTPTLFFANGERGSGGMQVAQLRAKLDEVAKQAGR